MSVSGTPASKRKEGKRDPDINVQSFYPFTLIRYVIPSPLGVTEQKRQKVFIAFHLSSVKKLHQEWDKYFHP